MNKQKPINHGTPSGYQQHRRRGIPACDACRKAHTAYDIARRHRNKEHTMLTLPEYAWIPTTLLADLYLNATPSAQIRAEQQLPPQLLEKSVRRYDREEAA